MARNIKIDLNQAQKDYDDEINSKFCPVCHIGILKEKYEQRPIIYKCSLCGYARKKKDENKSKRD